MLIQEKCEIFFPNDHTNHLKLYGLPLSWTALRKIYVDSLIAFMNHYMHGSLAEYYNQSYVKYHAGWQPGPWGVTVSHCLNSLSISQWVEDNPSAHFALLPHVFCTSVFMLINSQIIINVQYACHKRSHWVIATLFSLFWMQKGSNWHSYTFYY